MFDLSSPTKTRAPATRYPSIADAVPALFDKELLKDEADVEAVICSIECHLADRSNDFDDTLAKLAQPGPHILDFVLSGRWGSSYPQGHF